MTGEFVTDRHLGGYVAGGDPDTQYPDMWAWLVERESVRTVLDVGCGDGAAMRAFTDLGCHAFGIDGMAQEETYIATHDYTTGPYPFITADATEFDLVWSAEFVEHVEARYAANFLDSFARAPLVLMTHAQPGQPGHHHVNCQDSVYWQKLMYGNGYEVDAELTVQTRARAHGYYAATGIAFRRRP